MRLLSRLQIRLVVAVIASVIAPALAALVFAPSADAAPDKTKARPDSVTIQAGGPKVAVNVLANDKIAGNRKKAKISLVQAPAPSGMSLTVHRKTIVVSASQPTAAATVTTGYEVIDSLGRRSKGTITVTITAAPVASGDPASAE